MILVGTQQSLRFEQVSEAMVLQYPDFRGAPRIAGMSSGKDKDGKSKGSARSSSSSTTASTVSSGSSLGKGLGSTKKAWIAETPDPAQSQDQEAEQTHDLETIEEDANEPNEDDANDDGDQDLEEDSLNDLSELAEVLAVTAKKLSGLTLARGWNKPKGKPAPEDKTKSIEDAKRSTACGAPGHWYQDPECPMNAGGKREATSPSSFLFVLFTMSMAPLMFQRTPAYGSAFNTLVVSQVPAVPHHINEIKVSSADQFAALLVIDSGCQRTCCGKRWFDVHVQKLQTFGMTPHVIDANDLFQFGKGPPSTSSTRAYLPSGIHGAPMLLGTSILEENIPLLGSNSLMTRRGAVLNFASNWILFETIGVKAKVHRIGGHLAVSILDFHDPHVAQCPVCGVFGEEDLWVDPDPELLLSSPPLRQSQTASCTSSRTCSMAESGGSSDSFPAQHLLQPHDSSELWHPPEHHLGGSATSFDQEAGKRPSELPTRLHPEVRQHARPVLQMPAVQPCVQVEQGHQAVGISWVRRALFAVAALASTILGDHLSA